MRRLNDMTTRIIVSLVASLWLAIPAGAAEAPGFQAGAAMADITPEKFPVSLRGSFTPRPADAVNDPLCARALAIQNGDGRAVIVIVDNLGIARDTLDEIKARAAQATGWKTEQMLVAATHTHSAPSISGSGGSDAAAACREKAAAGILRALTDAVSRLQPATAAWGSDAVPEEVFNRRWFLKEGTMPPNPFGGIDKVKTNPPRDLLVKPAGPTDPEVSALDIRTRKRQALAVLANYALHYVGGTPPGKISADYFGEYARLMRWRVSGRPPENFVAMLSNGPCGDINNIDFTGTRPPREPFEQIRLVAAKVADASWRAVRNAEYHADAPVAMLQREVELAYRKPTAEQLEHARKILAMPKQEAEKLPSHGLNYAHRIMGAAERPDKVAVLVQALRIGDQAMVTIPFEAFVEIGLEIKKKSPFPRTFLIELANGSNGYLPTPKQHALGGYETWLGSNHVQQDASDILIRQLLEMLRELKGT
jgi:neutral ceramidase